MSMSYWMIEGVGLRADDLIPYLSMEKVCQLLIEQFAVCDQDEVRRLRQMQESKDYIGLDIDDYFYGNPFENIADLLTFCDDTDTITFSDDGDGNHYFYYPPSMPWHISGNDPQSPREVHERIIDAVMKLTNLSAKEIDKLIDDDLYVMGCG